MIRKIDYWCVVWRDDGVLLSVEVLLRNHLEMPKETEKYTNVQFIGC